MKVIYHPEVEKFILALPEKDNARVVKVVDLFKDYQFRLHQVYLKKITKEIWELRAGRYRLLFGMIHEDTIIVIIFMKKTQKTPKQIIDLAIRRLREYEK